MLKRPTGLSIPSSSHSRFTIAGRYREELLTCLLSGVLTQLEIQTPNPGRLFFGHQFIDGKGNKWDIVLLRDDGRSIVPIAVFEFGDIGVSATGAGLKSKAPSTAEKLAQLQRSLLNSFGDTDLSAGLHEVFPSFQHDSPCVYGVRVLFANDTAAISSVFVHGACLLARPNTTSTDGDVSFVDLASWSVCEPSMPLEDFLTRLFELFRLCGEQVPLLGDIPTPWCHAAVRGSENSHHRVEAFSRKSGCSIVAKRFRGGSSNHHQSPGTQAFSSINRSLGRIPNAKVFLVSNEMDILVYPCLPSSLLTTAVKGGDFIPVLTQLKELHAEGLCHADIRASNIVFNGNSSCLIDFDYCVREDAGMLYPLSWNVEIPDGERHPNACAGQPIERLHDVFSICAVMLKFAPRDADQNSQWQGFFQLVKSSLRFPREAKISLGSVLDELIAGLKPFFSFSLIANCSEDALQRGTGSPPRN